MIINPYIFAHSSTLNDSLFAVYKASDVVTTLNTGIYRVYNGDNVDDTSGNAQHGTNVGSVTFTSGKVGNAFTFNSSNYIELPNNSVNLTSSFSIGFWMNLQGVGLDKQSVINNFQYNGSANYYGWATYIENQVLRFTIYNGTTTETSVSYAIGAQYYSFHYFQLEYDWGSQMRIRLNGVTVATLNTAVTPVYGTTVGQTHTPTIGCRKYNGTTNYFLRTGGQIDALTIWNKQVTANEGVALYNGASGMEYPFSSAVTISSANDSLGVYNGTAQGGLTYGASASGNGFVFNGTNAYVSVADNSFNFASEFTIAFDLKVQGVGTDDQAVFGNWIYSAPNGFGWFIELLDSKLNLYILNGTSDLNPILFANYPYYGTNKRCVIVQKTTGKEIWIDGVLIASNSSTRVPVYTTTHYPTIGVSRYAAASYAYYMKNTGMSDEFYFWNRAITSTEIAELNTKYYPF